MKNMKTIKILRFLILIISVVWLGSCDKKATPIAQVAIDRVEVMPFNPQPYKQLKWKE
ncbi:MAG: hypothetical protein ACJAVY_001927, partial [Marinoscillum sp.]